jgi:hypothetical protein
MATKPNIATSTIELSIEHGNAESLKFTLSLAPGGLRVTRTMTRGMRKAHTMSLLFADHEELVSFLNADATLAEHRPFFDQVRRAGARLLS